MRTVYLVLGFVFLGLGAVGVVLPVLPTTPFLLISAFCFSRSSEKVDNWFKSTKLYKNNLETYSKNKAMKKGEKIRIMITVTIIMAFAFIMMRNTQVGRIAISVVWVCHIIAFTFFIKTQKEDEKENLEKDK